MYESAFWATPVLQSVRPVLGASHHVRTEPTEIERVADWLAWEHFDWPEMPLPFEIDGDPDRLTDFLLFINSLNFAFSDFETGVKFEAERAGRRWSDSEGLVACVLNALDAGIPILEGDWMARVTEDDLARVFAGTIRMPMLAERAAILNEVGATLVERYEGRWRRWFRSCAPAMYAGGDGLLERLPAEFPRFRDVSTYDGHEIRILKLGQLALWQLHTAHRPFGSFALRDLSAMTAFADYIVPVALRVMRVLSYSAKLDASIAAGDLIPRDSEQEVELRAHTLYATALLTEAVNQRRGPGQALVIPQVDFRLWHAFHATRHPHHLTRTTMY